jgi:hypothetical protein
MTKIVGSGSSKRHGSADPGSVPKCHGSATLKRIRKRLEKWQYKTGHAFIRLDPKFILKKINLKIMLLTFFV